MIEFKRHPVTGNVFSDWFEKYLRKGGHIEIKEIMSIESGDVIYLNTEWRLLDRWITVNTMATKPLPGEDFPKSYQYEIKEGEKIYCAGNYSELRKKFLDIGQNVA